MPPRPLTSTPRIVPAAPQRAPVVKPATTPARSAQVLQPGRVPQQLSLFMRPSGAR
jgi:hypothetical protein